MAAAVAFDPATALASRFHVPSADVQQWLQQAGYSIDELLMVLTGPASTLARTPISHFNVGAVGLAADGSLYVGVNLEFPGMPLNQSVHAEQFLVANLLAHGQQELLALAVNAAPCGHCRQFYSELGCADHLYFMFPTAQDKQQQQQQQQGQQHPPQQMRRWRLADLLPARFGPLDLLEGSSVPLLLQPQSHMLDFMPQARQALDDAAACCAMPAHASGLQDTAAAALAAARQSYAPYTHCPSGVAVLAGGKVYAGSYLESAAYNPGLHPLQAALVAAVMDGLPSYQQITHVVLAEKAGGIIQQRWAVQALARAITGDGHALVTVLHVD